MPRRSRARFRSSSKGGYLWATASIDPVSQAQGGQTIADLLPNVDRSILARATVLRIIGRWAVRPQSDDTDTASTLAIFILPADALAAGAVPELQFDLMSFLYTDTIWTMIGERLTGGELYSVRDIDSKAKRRMQSEDNRLCVQVENISPAAGSTFHVFALRILLKVP